MDNKRNIEMPGFGWIGARLTRKMIVALLALGILGWLLSCAWFLGYLKNTVAGAYDEVLAEAGNMASMTASFLEGSGGDCGGLDEFTAKWDISCTVRDPEGGLLYDSPSTYGERAGLSASATAIAHLSDGRNLSVYIANPDMERGTLVDAIGSWAGMGFLIYNICITAAAGLLLYLIIISPVTNLRKIMEKYSQKGEIPPRSSRRDEIGRLQNAFVELTEVLKAKEQSERRLIASISHDIKTPLTSILGYSQRLTSPNLSDEKKARYVDAIYEKGVALGTIIDEFDDYLDAGLRTSSPMELMTAGELCGAILDEYGDELADAGADFTVSCSCPDAKIICNLPHMKRYFGNLIGNSISHGGVSRPVLHLECFRDGGQLRLDFSDNGKGVPDELLRSIFEPLYTSDKGRKVSGLGLSICRSIISAHGGKVTAENISPGLLIRAVLPLAEV